MKRTKSIFFFVLALLAQQAHAVIIYGYEFDWTPKNGQSQYDASFVYSSGTVTSGVFTPTGLTTYSLGSPFGTITPATLYPGLTFYTDTPYGPSFQTQGTIGPIPDQSSSDPDSPYQEITGNNLALDIKGQSEIISYFDTKVESDIQLTGTWTETILTSPEGGSSIVLLAVALASLALFHAAHRTKPATRL